MAKRKKVDFNLASEVFEDASLTDSYPIKEEKKTSVKIASLVTNPYQPRLAMDKDAIEELAKSISGNGLLQPITVLDNGDDTFTIVFGHRRVAASEFLNHKNIDANILTSLDNQDLIISPIVENMQRKDMEPLETAIALDRVLKMGILKTQNDLSTSLGITQGRISKLLSILKLSQDVLQNISDSHYKDVTVLAALNKVNPEKQLEVFDQIKILPRSEALEIIKKSLTSKKIKAKRIIHSNNTIKINTKNISPEIKSKVLAHINEIELLLKETSNG